MMAVKGNQPFRNHLVLYRVEIVRLHPDMVDRLALFKMRVGVFPSGPV